MTPAKPTARHRRKVGRRIPRGRWTHEELQRLHYHWGAPLKSLSKILGRTPAAIAEKARVLGLRNPRKELTAVAREIGIDREALLRLCARHRIRITRSVSTGICHRCVGNPHRYVDPDDVIAAYQKEAETETAYGAARRLGHDGEWLVRRLKAAGVWQPGWWVRYPSATIEAAVAAYGRGVGGVGGGVS